MSGRLRSPRRFFATVARGIVAACAFAGGTWTAAEPGAAQSTAALITSAVTVTGTITDARNLPVVGAVITARGSAVGWTATRHDGSYVLTIPPGAYELLVRKGGYVPSALMLSVKAGATKVVSLALAEANLTSVAPSDVENTDSGVTLDTGVAARATLSAARIADRPEPSLRNVALELPGLTLDHPADSVPDSSLVVRGGTVETRVQIDGHAVSAGATGRWNSSYATAPLFDSVEVVKGIALSGANAGESAFGTINLRTRDFTRTDRAEVVIGADALGGTYQTLAFSGNAFKDDRLSYVLEHSVNRLNGPGTGRVVNEVVPEAGGTALFVGRAGLDDSLVLRSDLFKLRWRLNSTTSIMAGYVGLHGGSPDAGGAYATFLGDRTIVPSAPDAIGGTIAGPTQFAGATVPAYVVPQQIAVVSNQPLFEAEFRTAFKNDTVLIRPYAGSIEHAISGWSANTGDPTTGSLFSEQTAGPGCSAVAPCFTANSGNSPFRMQENDSLHGTTATLVHPMGDTTLTLSYDYRSDQTEVASGDPNIRFDGDLLSLFGFQETIPATVARTSDWSATYAAPVGRRLRFFAGEYYTDWQLDYAAIDVIPNYGAGTISRTTRPGSRAAHVNNPHAGLVWRPQSDTAVRFSAGSAVTLPFAELISGGLTGSGLLSGGQLSLKNPMLAPEVTFAYNLGADHRFAGGTVVSVDAFDNTIHDVFATRVTPFDGAIIGLPASAGNGGFATTAMPVNAPLERNYGVEVSVARAPHFGVGYRVAATLQRAFVDDLTPALIGTRSTLTNGKQLDGSSAVPFAQGFAWLDYRHRSGVMVGLGATYTGANNWTNGPAFTDWSSLLRYDLRGGYRAQFSIENLFDARTGSIYSSGTAQPLSASPASFGSALENGAPVFGATPTTRYGIAPRTFRLQLEAHLGN